MADAPVRLTGVSSMATRALLAELTGDYAARIGAVVEIESVGGLDAARRVRAGERFDLVVLASPAIDALEAEGHLLPGERVDLAVSTVALAGREGAAPVDLGDEAAVRAALLQAHAIGYSTGPSGDHLLQLIERWGLAETLGPRLKRAPPGVPVARLIAQGEVEFGLQQFSELKDQPRVAVFGWLPAGIEGLTVFVAALGAQARDPAAARELLAFLASPKTAEVKRRHGMEPAA